MTLAERSTADTHELENYVDRFSPIVGAWLAVVTDREIARPERPSQTKKKPRAKSKAVRKKENV